MTMSPREKVALKPCPFCGGTATRYTAIASHPNRQVSCGTCGASAFDIKWNRRTAIASGSGDHAELARLSERNVELSILAYKWMEAHDALMSGPVSYTHL